MVLEVLLSSVGLEGWWWVLTWVALYMFVLRNPLPGSTATAAVSGTADKWSKDSAYSDWLVNGGTADFGQHQQQPWVPKGKVVAHNWMFKLDLQRQENNMSSELHERRVQPFGIAAAKQHISTDIVNGEVKFNRFLKYVYTGFTWRPKKGQLTMVQMMIQTLAPNIFGAKDWGRIGQRVMMQMSWKCVPPVFGGSMPRRMGKSAGYAIVLNSYALTNPGKTVLVFSTGGRASGGLREAMVALMQSAGLEHRIVSGIKGEILEIKCDFEEDGLDTCVIKFFPASAEISIILFMIMIMIMMLLLPGPVPAPNPNPIQQGKWSPRRWMGHLTAGLVRV